MIATEVLLAGLVCSALLTAVLTALVWRERPKTGATALAVVLAGLAMWGLGQAVVVGVGPLRARLLGYALSLFGSALVSVPWLVFAMQYVGRGAWVTRRRVALLALEPLAITGLALTNPVHELVWTAPELVTAAGGTALVYGWGPALLAHVVVCYAVVLTGDWLLARKFLASRNVYRKRTFLFVLMSVSVVVASAVSFAGLSPLPHLTLTPVMFLGYGVLSLLLFSGNWFISALPLERLFALLRSRSKNLAPVARDTAIEELATGFVVLDHENRIVDINPMGRRMLGREGDRIVGKSLTDVLPRTVFVDDEPAFLEAGVTGQFTGVWVKTPDGEARCYDVTVTEIAIDGDEAAGRVGLMHDVTDRERRKQRLEAQNHELERQNEQLEQFANIVSHDLRNPLNVANGRLELVDAGPDQEHVDEARGALARIEDIIRDVLTLARLGKTVDETEPIELAVVAREAWGNVSAPEATLVVDVDDTVEASHGRLLQVFENLYRNAVEHGRPDVTVTVGSLPTGFYVADDGPGLPDAHLEDVLDEGFTTEDDGTGFGLSIVETIAEAHGWDVRATNATTGGARFEFTGLESTQKQEPRPLP
jgi:PAS domain S-box-containing protein